MFAERSGHRLRGSKFLAKRMWHFGCRARWVGSDYVIWLFFSTVFPTLEKVQVCSVVELSFCNSSVVCRRDTETIGTYLYCELCGRERESTVDLEREGR